MSEPVVRVRDLVKHHPNRSGAFSRHKSVVRAVDGVSFDIAEGEILGLVGESGCGKSTVAKLLMGIVPATSGSIEVLGEDLAGASARGLRRVRRQIQIVMQDPYSSLNPRMTVGDLVAEPLHIHSDLVPRPRRRERVKELLDMVGLDPDHVNRYPHQFSGGQRQRIGIARALAVMPRVMVCDEPVSALDVSVQAQVVNLLAQLRRELGLSILFIAHDLSIVRHISDRIAVMYLGRIVETGTDSEIATSPSHPYTQGLLAAVPVADPSARGSRERIVVQGDVASAANLPSGCRFRTRCPIATDACQHDEPQLIALGSDSHYSACHFAARFTTAAPYNQIR